MRDTRKPTQRLVVLLILWLASIPCGAQVVLWERSLSGSAAEVALDAAPMPNGDLLVLGARRSELVNDSGNGGVSLARISLDGDVRWHTSLPVDTLARPTNIFAIGDGRYRIIGWQGSGLLIGLFQRVWTAVVDSNGSLISHGITTTIDQSLRINKVRVDGRNGYIGAGVEFHTESDTFYAISYGLDSQARDVGTAGYGYAHSFNGTVVLPDRMRVSVGSRIVAGRHQAFLMRQDFAGGWHLWSTRDTTVSERAFDVAFRSTDSSVYVVLFSQATDSSTLGRLVFARNSYTLTESWRVTPGIISDTSELLVVHPREMHPWDSSSFVIVGEAGPSRTVPFVLVVDHAGRTLWRHVLGDPTSMRGTGQQIVRTSDGYILLGSRNGEMLVTRIAFEGTTGVETERVLPQELDLSVLSAPGANIRPK